VTAPRFAGFRRILLTGGSGFVGGYLCPLLADETPDARRVLLNRPGDDRSRTGWEPAFAEIFDEAAIAAIIEEVKPDLVLHLAAQSSVGAGHASAGETWRTNFGGSFALALACSRFTPEATVLFASSAEVYGLSFRQGKVDEDAPLRPQNPYARSKAAAEQMLGDILAPTNQLIVTRAFNHTGPGQDERFVLPSFAAQIARIEAGRQPPCLQVGNLDAERDFLDVRDVCRGYLALIEAARSLPARAVFNISSGRARSIHDLLQTMKAYSKAQFDVVVDPERLRGSDIPRAVGSSSRLQAAVAWRPAIDLRETLEALVDAARLRSEERDLLK